MLLEFFSNRGPPVSLNKIKSSIVSKSFNKAGTTPGITGITLAPAEITNLAVLTIDNKVFKLLVISF